MTTVSRKPNILQIMSTIILLIASNFRLKSVRFVFSQILRFIAIILENRIIVRIIAICLRSSADLIAYDTVGSTLSECMEAVGNQIQDSPPPPIDEDIILDTTPKDASKIDSRSIFTKLVTFIIESAKSLILWLLSFFVNL